MTLVGVPLNTGSLCSKNGKKVFIQSHLNRGPLADLSTPKDQNLEIKVKKNRRFGEKPGGLSTASKRTKTRCRKDIKMKIDC